MTAPVALAALLVTQLQPTIVRAVGEAEISLHPDQSKLRIGVVSTAATTKRASAGNAARATEIITHLHDALGQDADIRTTGYSLTKSGSNGYIANSAVEVTIHHPSDAGKVIDTAAGSGASIIGGLEFSTLNDQDARAEALKQATAMARANADAIATGLGLHFVRVVNAETVPAPSPGTIKPIKKKTQAPTPIEPGLVDFRVRVAITIEAAP
jgi:uncharacterized protein YggE